MSDYADVRPIIVAEHASTRFGGEAILPFHYFRFLRKRGVEAWLVVHERTRQELDQVLATERDRIHYVPDRLVQKVGARLCDRYKTQLVNVPAGMVIHGTTQLDERRLVRALVQKLGATIVHEPIPVSPKAPSLMYDVGAPVIIGPMNGGMTYPPGFTGFQSGAERGFVRLARKGASAAHLVMPGKRRAAALLVANERTRRALPAGVSERVIELVENGVDLSLFARPERPLAARARPRFAFVGRLVRWKAVDLLLDALARALADVDLELVVLGDGPERPRLEDQANRLGIGARVTFEGFLPQRDCAAKLADSDALVLPSLYECGGAVVLEAMAVGLPVIATRWGGPADYLDAETGILVDPTGPGPFVEGLRQAIVRLARSPEERQRLGAAARRRVEERFDWERKIDRIIEIYREVQATSPRPGC